jgi:hypothetical protein
VRPCGSLRDTRAREIYGVEAVGFIVNYNGGVELVFLQAKNLGTLEVGTTSTEFIPARHVEENLL